MRVPAHSSYLAPLRRRTGRCPGRRRRGAFKRGVSRNPHLARLKAEKRGGEGGEGGEWRVRLVARICFDGNTVLCVAVYVFASLTKSGLVSPWLTQTKTSTPMLPQTTTRTVPNMVGYLYCWSISIFVFFCVIMDNGQRWSAMLYLVAVLMVV